MFVIRLISIPLSILLRAWQIQLIWNWFGTLFVDRPIDLKESLAICLVIAAVRGVSINDVKEILKSKDDPVDELVDNIILPLLLQLFSIFIPWLYYVLIFKK